MGWPSSARPKQTSLSDIVREVSKAMRKRRLPEISLALMIELVPALHQLESSKSTAYRLIEDEPDRPVQLDMRGSPHDEPRYDSGWRSPLLLEQERKPHDRRPGHQR